MNNKYLKRFQRGSTVGIISGILLISFNNCQPNAGFSVNSPGTASSSEASSTTPPPSNNTNSSGSTGSDAFWNVPINLVNVGSSSAIGAYPGFTYNLTSTRPYISLRSLDLTRNAVMNNSVVSYNRTAAQRLKSLTDPIVQSILASDNAGTGEYSALDLIYIYYTYKNFTAYKAGEPTALDYLRAAIKVKDREITQEFDLVSSNTTPNVQYNQSLYEGPVVRDVAYTFDYGYDLLTLEQKEKWSAYVEQVLSQHWSLVLSSWDATQKKYLGASHGTATNCWHWKPEWTTKKTAFSGAPGTCVNLPASGAGWAVNDPGNNYFYSFVTSTLSWAISSRNTKWFNFAQNYIFPLLVEYYSTYTGGGTREGTSYGVALKELFAIYNIWRDSTGEDLSSFNAHSKDTITYWIHATSPDFKKYSPWGDQPMYPDPFLFDYNRQLMIEAVNLSPSSAEAKYGQWWLNSLNLGQGLGVMGTRNNSKFDLLVNPNIPAVSPADATAPLATTYFSQINGILSARSSWDPSASWFLTLAGLMDQSHAHEEQGSFIFYKQGWITAASNLFCNLCGATSDKNILRFVDSNGGTKPQFGGAYNTDFNHQIKDANGNYYKRQIPTMTYQELDNILRVKIDIPGEIYHNPDAWLALRETPDVVKSWTRNFEYNKTSHQLRIYDKCELLNNGSAIFQMHFTTDPVISGNTVTAANMTATFTLLNTQTPIRINKIYMPTVASNYSGGYKIEIPLPSCEITSTIQIK